jgi:hypothetical protein
VRIESDNRALRKEIGELQAILAETKRASEDPGTIHLTRRPGEPPKPMAPSNPVPDIYTMGAQRPLTVQEQVLQGWLDEARRKLASSDSVGVQLKTRLEIINGQLLAARKALTDGNTSRVQELLVDACRTTNTGLLVRVPLPVQGAPYPEQRESLHFDDEKPKPPSSGKGPERLG